MHMTPEEIADAAQSLAGQLAAGIPAVEGATLMSQVQPDYAEFWTEAAQNMATGRLLSDSLREVWPEGVVAIVLAGEQSGKTDSVLAQIEEVVRLQIAMREEVSRLRKPLGVLAVGTSVFLFMLLYVIPNFNAGMRTSSTANADGFTSLSLAINAWIAPIWTPLLATIGAGAFVAFNWVKTEGGKATVQDFALTVPWFGPAIRDFHYSVWARFMGTVHAAGIPLIDGLALTRAGMPVKLREGIARFEYELREKNSSVELAADAKNWSSDDQRHDWPLYLRRAFIVGANTGKSEQELGSASALIMKYAQRRFSKAVQRANFIAFIGCGLMAMLSAIALYLPILTSLKNLR